MVLELFYRRNLTKKIYFILLYLLSATENLLAISSYSYPISYSCYCEPIFAALLVPSKVAGSAFTETFYYFATVYP